MNRVPNYTGQWQVEVPTGNALLLKHPEKEQANDSNKQRPEVQCRSVENGDDDDCTQIINHGKRK